MPKRSNLFQDVVAAVHRHIAGSAEVEESAMLLHRASGKLREVDVVIRESIAGQPIVISVEATSGSRRADLPWVEQQIQKHAEMETSKLILVADGGFTAPARAMAQARNAAAIAPEDLDGGDPTYVVANHMQSVWARLVTLTPREVMVHVSPRDTDEIVVLTNPPQNLDLVRPDGAFICSLEDCVRGLLNTHLREYAVSQRARYSEGQTQGSFELLVAPLTATIDGNDVELCAQWLHSDGSKEQHPITRVEMRGAASIGTAAVEMGHQRFGTVVTSFGEFSSDGKPVRIIATAVGSDERLVVQIRDTPHGPAHTLVGSPLSSVTDA